MVRRHVPPTATPAMAAVLSTGSELSAAEEVGLCAAEVLLVCDIRDLCDVEKGSSLSTVVAYSSSGTVDGASSSGIVSVKLLVMAVICGAACVEVDCSADTSKLTRTPPPIRVDVDLAFEVLRCVVVLAS